MKRLLALLATVLAVTLGLAACHGGPHSEVAGPNKVCPAGQVYLSSQGWWQKDNGFGGPKVPQELPSSGVGGHLHVELCFPINARYDGATMPLTVNLKTHQRFTGQGDKLDVGNGFKSGASIVSKPVTWPSSCAPGAMCETTVQIDVPLTGLTSTQQLFRVRYLPANQPNGERQFTSNELPFFLNSDAPVSNPCSKAVEGKGWYGTTEGFTIGDGLEYARSGNNKCLPGHVAGSGYVNAISGTVALDQRMESTHVQPSYAEIHVDSRFGSDDFSGLVPGSQYTIPNGQGIGSSTSRIFNLDTTRYADGWHCLQTLTNVPDPTTGTRGDGVITGVLEFPILIDNPGGLSDVDARNAETGKGACYSFAPSGGVVTP